MQQSPLLVHKILDYATKFHGDQTIVSRSPDDPAITKLTTWKEIGTRSRLCSLFLRNTLGAVHGDRIATLAWNTSNHIECWYGIAGIGAISHTLNPRLFEQDLVYIISHAQDSIIMADAMFLPLLEKLLPSCSTLKHVVLLTDRQHYPEVAAQKAASASGIHFHCYEDLLVGQQGNIAGFEWEQCNENDPCGLCYTSGTTGNPKGVLYTHRSNFLHAFVVTMPDALSVSSNSTILMIVPMLHANSWGLVYAAPLTGASLVLPAQYLDGPSVYDMIEQYHVTLSAGVPTVWQQLHAYLTENNLKLTTLKAMVVGGAAVQEYIVRYFEHQHGIEVRHLWGMTETSPIGSIAGPPVNKLAAALDSDSLVKLKLKQGRPHILLDMRIVDDTGKELPHDGVAFGDLQVRGPHCVSHYYKADAPATDSQGWFSTGDVATIDTHSYMQIVDRSKDVIKSGGEWISSVEIENIAAGHPGVAEAAVIAVPHEKWTERPLLVIVRNGGGTSNGSGNNNGKEVSKQEVLDFLKGKIATWWMPDDVVFVQEIPHTATGKISKLTLRKMLIDDKQSGEGGASCVIKSKL